MVTVSMVRRVGRMTGVVTMPLHVVASGQVLRHYLGKVVVSALVVALVTLQHTCRLART